MDDLERVEQDIREIRNNLNNLSIEVAKQGSITWKIIGSNMISFCTGITGTIILHLIGVIH